MLKFEITINSRMRLYAYSPEHATLVVAGPTGPVGLANHWAWRMANALGLSSALFGAE